MSLPIVSRTFLFAAGATLLFAASAVAQQTHVLKVAMGGPPTSPVAQWYQEHQKSLAAKSGGRLKLEIFWNGTLGPPPRIDYLVLRRLVLTQGLDALSVSQAPASPEGETVTPLDAYRESIDLDRSG